MEYSTKIYLHKRLDTGEVFYVGIGGGDRPWETGNRNKFWRNIVKKAGYEVVVIEDCLTWDQACEIETMLVAHYGRRDRGKGPLVNLTDGGDGVKGRKCSPETRAKLSAVHKGKTHSPETRAKISASQKGNTSGSAHKGRTFSSETLAKMSAANKGKTPSNKGIPMSQEQRDKLSAISKAYWEAKRKGH